MINAYWHIKLKKPDTKQITSKKKSSNVQLLKDVIGQLKEDKQFSSQIIITQNTIIAKQPKALPPPNPLDNFSEKLKKRAKTLTDDLYRYIYGHLNATVVAESLRGK